MSTINSYLALKDAVRTWMNRSDAASISAIPYCIGFAEEDFHRTFRLPQMEKRMSFKATSVEIPIEGKFALPDDYYEGKHLVINGQSFSRVDVEAFRRIEKGDVLTNADVPKGVTYNMFGQGSSETKYYFTRIGNEIFTLPQVKAGDVIDFIYYKNYEPMDSDNDYPESLQVGPDVMLYLTLRHSALFLRDNEQAQFWEQKAEQSGQRLMQRLDEIEWSGSHIVVPALK